MRGGDLIASLAGMAQSTGCGIGVYAYPDGSQVNITVKRGKARRDLLYSVEQVEAGLPTPDTFIVARAMRMTTEVLAEAKAQEGAQP